MKLIKRKSDSALFRPSFPDRYEEGEVFRDMLSGGSLFYFCGIRRHREHWWQLWRRRYVDTGEIWEPDSGEFEVFDVKWFDFTVEVV